MTPATIPCPDSNEADFLRLRARLPAIETRLLVLFGIVLAAFRLLSVFRLNLNSDEPQHLHVVWAWATGQLPYRDVFDNHAPLFQILCAPLFKLFGETARIVFYMRLAMVPLFALTLGAVYYIGARLFSRRVGAWSILFAGFSPWFFFPSVEFRTDNLWTALWTVTIAALVAGGPWTTRRFFIVGLLAGAALSVSMKTTLLLAALALAGMVTLACFVAAGRRVPLAAAAGRFAALIAGTMVIPAALVAFFVHRGAWDAMYYCIVEHNRVPFMNTGRIFFVRQMFPLTLPFLLWGAWRLLRAAETPELGLRRALLLLSTAFYVTMLCSFWPLLTRQDFLPFLPLGFLLVTAFGVWVGDRIAWQTRGSWRFAALLSCLVAEVTLLCVDHKPWRDHISTTLHDLAETLRVTNPDDYVMDAKSGAIFRRRPYFYVLETLTRGRIVLGWVKDDIVERLIATRTCMASDDRLVDPALDFVLRNYLPMNRKMRVAGKLLTPEPKEGKVRFQIRIPARYGFVTPAGEAAGSIDGAAYHGAVFLDAGEHEFIVAPPQPQLTVCWAQALERGFSPFPPR